MVSYYRMATGNIVVAWRQSYQDLTLEDCKLMFGRLYLQQNKT